MGKSLVKASAEGVEKSVTITIWDSSAPRTEIFVSDAGNFQSGPWKILRYDEQGATPEVFITSNLAWPQDIVFLEADNVMLVSNLISGSLAKFNSSTGSFVGSFATGIGGPTRMKIGADDLLYVLQWQGNGKVLRYTLGGTFVDEFTSVGVYEGIGLDWDSNGNLYVSSFNDGLGGYVRKFGPSGNDLGLFISSNIQGPTNIWFDAIGNMLVNDWQAGKIEKFNSNGIYLSTFIAGLSLVEGVDFLDNGDFLIGNGGTGAIKMFSNSGAYINDLVESGSGGLMRPNAVIIRKVNF